MSSIQQEYGVGKVERFSKDFFQSPRTYNKLLLSFDFFQRFRGYEYILIHQLDGFVFEDRLCEWCNKDYDYIGAPWLGLDWPNDIVKKLWKPFWAHLFIFKDLFHKKDNLVGNGGFSLRKVQTSLKVIRLLDRYASRWENWELNEDVFWSIYVSRLLPFYSVPDANTAARFSLEKMPHEGMVLNGGIIPFGCHAWEKSLEFWRQYIEQQGYSLDD